MRTSNGCGPAGATEVVPEAIEGSLMLASHALALVGVPMRRVIRVVQDQRNARYGLLRGYFHGADDDTVNEMHSRRLLSVTLPPAGRAGRPLADLGLHALEVDVVSVRRAGGGVLAPNDALTLEGGDTLVLSGLPEQLAKAEASCWRHAEPGSSPAMRLKDANVARARVRHLPMQKRPEYLAEQIVGAELAGDLAQAFVGEAQFLGQQFERRGRAGEHRSAASARCPACAAEPARGARGR